MDAEGDKHEGGRESVCSDTGGDMPGVDTNLFPLLSFKRKAKKTPGSNSKLIWFQKKKRYQSMGQEKAA